MRICLSYVRIRLQIQVLISFILTAKPLQPRRPNQRATVMCTGVWLTKLRRIPQQTNSQILWLVPSVHLESRLLQGDF